MATQFEDFVSDDKPVSEKPTKTETEIAKEQDKSVAEVREEASGQSSTRVTVSSGGSSRRSSGGSSRKKPKQEKTQFEKTVDGSTPEETKQASRQQKKSQQKNKPRMGPQRPDSFQKWQRQQTVSTGNANQGRRTSSTRFQDTQKQFRTDTLQPEIAPQEKLNRRNATPDFGPRDRQRLEDISDRGVRVSDFDEITETTGRGRASYNIETGGGQGTVTKRQQENLDVIQGVEAKKTSKAAGTTLKTAGIGAAAGVAAPFLPGAISLVGVTVGSASVAKELGTISRIRDTRPEEARFRAQNVFTGVISAVGGGVAGSKAAARFKTKSFELTKAKDPLVLQKGKEQRLFTKEFKVGVKSKKTPKPDNVVGVDFNSADYRGVTTVFSKGKGTINLKSGKFKVTSKKPGKTMLNEQFRPQNELVFTSKKAFTKPQKGKGVEVSQSFNKVRVQKTQLKETVLQDTKTPGLVATKGKFRKVTQPKSKAKTPNGFSISGQQKGQKFLAAGNKDFKVLAVKKSSKSPFDMVTKPSKINVNRETGVSATLKTKTTQKSFTPTTKVTKTSTEPKGGFFSGLEETQSQQSQSLSTRKGQRQKRPKVDVKSEYNFKQEGFVGPKRPKQETIQKPKPDETPKPPVVVTRPDIKRSDKKGQGQKPGDDLTTPPKPPLQQKQQQQQSITPQTLTPKQPPGFPGLPSFSLGSGFNKRKAKPTVFSVDVRRKGKQKTIARGLTKGQATIRLRSELKGTLARSGRVKGFTGLDLGSAFRKPKKGSDLPFGSVVQKRKFSLSSFGEKTEIKKEKKRKGILGGIL